MNIILDAMGGDRAPEQIVIGAAQGIAETGVNITLVGDQAQIEKYLPSDANRTKIDIVHTDVAITMEDDPISVVRSKKDSSMGIGLKMLKEGGDAFVSAGNTGALHAGSSLIIRTVAGIHRSAIGMILPFNPPVLMLYCGANTSVTSEYLEQWAQLGSIYMKNVMKVESPRVGLLNNGTESHKGTAVVAETYKLLSETENINFAGNVESSAIPFNACDVLVTDGFTGNVTLKMIEGMGKFMFLKLKDIYTANWRTKLSYLMTKDRVRGLKKEFDASEHGGAPLLGLSKPVIKAHGNSDAKAIRNAIRQAVTFIETESIKEFEEAAARFVVPKE